MPLELIVTFNSYVSRRLITKHIVTAAQLERAAGNMGDKIDREHRLHPVGGERSLDERYFVL